MKKIIITGAGSFIGTSVEKRLAEFPADYTVETVDMLDGDWRQRSLCADTVFHVAGIAHADTGNVSAERQAFYYKINTELTVETAKKAKADGAGQFIFMSSAIVYGDSAPLGQDKLITASTAPQPANYYGDSKLKAEQGVRALADGSFCVCVLRPPMIYGPGCKGNYPVLSSLARKLPLFPDIDNRRSMLYIDNLAEFVRLMIDDRTDGIFFPQNSEYSRTSDLVEMIAAAHGKKIKLTKAFNWALRLAGRRVATVNKAFGSLRYDMALSDYPRDYRLVGLRESIRQTEAAL